MFDEVYSAPLAQPVAQPTQRLLGVLTGAAEVVMMRFWTSWMEMRTSTLRCPI